MTAPAIILVTDGPNEPAISECLASIARSLGNFRPDLRVLSARVGDASPRIDDVITSLVKDDVAEAVLVPLSFTSASIDLSAAFTPSVDINIATSRPIGPASEVLNILDERMREALRQGGALEIDALVLAAPSGGDIRGLSLLSRRARQWSAHHKLPVQLGIDEGDGRGTAAAVTALRGQGRRHIAVGSLFLAPDTSFSVHAQAATRAGAIAVTAPIGDSAHLRQLILARYAFGAMELLDGKPTQLPVDDLDADEDDSPSA